MKIGIITFHKANNYGAVLQAYALQQYLFKLGHDVEIIDYCPNNKVSSKTNLASKLMKYIKQPIKQLKARNTARANTGKFEFFRKENLLLTPNQYNDRSIEIDPPHYDCYIAGSDQIWNTDLSNQSKAFYLHFVKEGLKISYAASFGKKELSKCDEDYILNYLKTFDRISVREKYHAYLLKICYNIDAEVTLDPVFLLTKYDWEKIIKPINNLPAKYILVYVLECSDQLFECARIKAQELNSDIVYISLVNKKISGNVLRGIGPSEFLYVISNASYICTNSFHGVAFSIIFNKNFTVIEHSTRNSRIDNILNLLSLEDRKYSAHNLNNINYNVINQRLNNLINHSQKFLKDCLSI